MPAGKVADDLRRAHAEDDDETIRQLADSTWPDPFEVAARMLFPPTPDGRPTPADRAALGRFAAAASDATGVRAFIEYWLDAGTEAFARERELWRVTARVTMRRKRGDLASALEAADTALPLLDVHEHSHQGPGVRRLRAVTLRGLGRATEAVAVLEDLATRLRERRWPAFEGRTRAALVDAYVGEGRTREHVLEECRRAERLLIGAHDWKILFPVLEHTAASQMQLARFPEAEETVYRAMVVAKRTGREEDLLHTTLHLADVTARMGRHESALALRLQVFDRAREADLVDPAAWAAQDLVWVEIAAGRTAAAMAYGDWLEDHADRVTDAQQRADTSLVLGDLAALRGRDSTAARHYRRALEGHRGAGSMVRVFTVLSRILRMQEESVDLSSDGRAVLASLREAAQSAARASNTLAVLTEWSARELATGYPEEAAHIAKRAMAYASSHAEDPDAPLAPLQLARVALADRRWSDALGLLEPLGASLPEHHAWRVAYFDRLGLAYAGQGRWSKSVEAYRRAVDEQRTSRSGLAVREAISQRGSEHTLATRGMNAARGWWEAEGGPDALEAAWWFHEMASSRLLARTLTDESELDADPDEPSAPLARALAEVERAHDFVVRTVLAGDEDSQGEARRALHETYETLARAEARAARHAGRNAPVRQPTTLARLRAALDPDVALLAYTLGPEGVVGMVVTSDGARVERHGDTPAARQLLSRWRQLASTPRGPEAKLAARLYDTFVRPFEAHVASRSRWIVLPDGAMSGVPIDAWIRTHDGTSERVIESHTVTYAHGHEILEALTLRQAQRGDGLGVVALGDPTHPLADAAAPGDWQVVAALGRGGLRMPPLPSSGTEARSVAALYPEAQRTLLLEDEARRATWLQAVERLDRPLDCVHLACHGLLDDRLPSLSGLVFAGGEMLTAERLQATRVPADLVVLSACQSGGGTVAAGEGLLGLTRAFLGAGATRVLCTTWQVADASTAELMLDFHRARIERRLDDAAALRAARLAAMQEPATAHPYFWAGFQLWGAGAP